MKKLFLLVIFFTQLTTIVACGKNNNNNNNENNNSNNNNNNQNQSEYKISAGYGTCLIDSPGFIKCQGQAVDNASTQLAGQKIKNIAIGAYFYCVIQDDDEGKCYGSNGTLPMPNNLGKIKTISVGHNDVCAINAQDDLNCWLYNHAFTSFSQITTTNQKVKSVANGMMGFLCAVLANESLQCWNVPDEDNEAVSALPNDLGKVKAVACGEDHVCAIKADDTVRCWGSNLAARITVPDDLGKVKFLSINHGYFGCAIKADDTVQCFGQEDFGRTIVPNNLGKVKALAAGLGSACAIKMDNSLQCWGDDTYYSQLITAR